MVTNLKIKRIQFSIIVPHSQFKQVIIKEKFADALD